MQNSEKIRIEDAPYTPVLKRITTFFFGGAVIDGYLLIIIGIALLQAVPDLNLDVYWSGLCGAAALVGILVGGLIFGYMTDRLGRKLMYRAGIVAMLVLSIAQMFVQDGLQLVICRFLIGLAIGADYPMSTALISEFTPKRYRGTMGGTLITSWYVGAILASAVGYFLLISGEHTWRWMLGSSAILAVIVMYGRWLTPESPRWLLSKGRTEEARQVIKKVWGEQYDIENLEEESKQETVSYSEIFQGEYLKRLIFVCAFWVTQVIPCFALYTFGPQILTALGMGEGNMWIWGYTILNVFFFLGCLPALRWIETIGRRPVIIWSFVFMTASLLVLGIVPQAPVAVIIACFAIYAFASGGPSVLDGVYPVELFPTNVRASAYGIATAVSRLGAAVGTYLLPVGLQQFGVANTMLAAAAVTAVGLVFCITMAPETKGKSLTEASSISK